MHMLSLILAAEVYHCWEIFNMNHMRHKPQRFPRSHRGFHVSAGQLARARRVPARHPLPSAPARPARPQQRGPSAVFMGSMMSLVAHSSPELGPKNPIRNL